MREEEGEEERVERRLGNVVTQYNNDNINKT